MFWCKIQGSPVESRRPDKKISPHVWKKKVIFIAGNYSPVLPVID